MQELISCASYGVRCSSRLRAAEGPRGTLRGGGPTLVPPWSHPVPPNTITERRRTRVEEHQPHCPHYHYLITPITPYYPLLPTITHMTVIAPHFPITITSLPQLPPITLITPITQNQKWQGTSATQQVLEKQPVQPDVRCRRRCCGRGRHLYHPHYPRRQAQLRGPPWAQTCL